MFIKKGIDKAKDQFIYPHPTQTGTGNCAAYAGATCFYAFGLDHDPGLIPTVDDGTDEVKFQVAIARMVERLTELCYHGGFFSSVADGYRDYLKECKLGDKYEVVEIEPYEEEDIPDNYPDTRVVSKWPYIKSELKRCQDIIAYIEWSNGFWHFNSKHAITIVGFDDDNDEIIAANPWGNPRRTSAVTPKDAGENTEAGKTERAHQKYKHHVGDDDEVKFEGHDAWVYNYVKICPVERLACRVDTEIHPETSTSGGEPVRRYTYAVANETAQRPLNGFAVSLPGLSPSDVFALAAPEGWTTAIWYREHEPHFDFLAPEIPPSLPGILTFAGVLWRTSSRPVTSGDKLDGFTLEVRDNSRALAIYARTGRSPENSTGTRAQQAESAAIDCWLASAASVDEWADHDGHASLLYETRAGTQAWHVDATVPRRASDLPGTVRKLIDAAMNFSRHRHLTPAPKPTPPAG